MKKFKKANNAKRHLVQHLVNSFGERRHKMAYQSIIGNITGLTRKVQSLHQLLKNADNHIGNLEAENVALKRDLLLGDKVSAPCSMGVGDGTGNLVVYGDYDSIKAAQAFVFRAEDASRDAAKWKETAIKAHEEAEEAVTLAKHWRRIAEEAQEKLSQVITLPKVNHPAQFEYADKVADSLKLYGLEVKP